MGALAIDLVLGEPPSRLHPVVWMGRLTGFLDSRIARGKGDLLAGALMAMAVVLSFALLSSLIGLFRPLHLSIWGLVCAAGLKTTFALRALGGSVVPMGRALEEGDLDAARERAAMLVSRDVRELDQGHLTSCAVETVSENMVDSLISPWLFMGVGGLPAAMAYRAVNTLDAMVGYRSERHSRVGWFSARADDLLNLIPARLSLPFILMALRIRGGDWRAGWRAARGQHARTASPNKGWPMAALAGGMGIRMEKEGHYSLGEGDLPLPGDIVECFKVVRTTALLFFFLFALPLFVVVGMGTQLLIEDLLLEMIS